jgi:hypothetical protein
MSKTCYLFCFFSNVIIRDKHKNIREINEKKYILMKYNSDLKLVIFFCSISRN